MSDHFHGVRLLEFQAIGDERGWLTALEEGSDLPFSVRRVYTIYGTLPNVSRGFHAHHDLEQIAICVAGRCTFLVDDGRSRAEFVLDSPNKGLYIGSPVWREMHHFSLDCVLVVLASRPYDPDDYIRDYSEFKALIEELRHG